MKETIRCCIACILPCGALDVIRIVHASGHVEQIGHAVSAGDVMRAHPKHVLLEPPRTASVDHFWAGASEPQRPVVLPPAAELRRGRIYFLAPVSSSTARLPRGRRRAGKEESRGTSDRCLAEVVKERVQTSERERRRGNIGAWRPHLESISELAGDV